MCNVDAGLSDPDWPGDLPYAWELCRHGRTVGGYRSRQQVWTADDLLGRGTRLTGRELLAYRARCPQCGPDVPAVAQWVLDADARADLAARLVIAEWHTPCAWCPVTQGIHGVPVNPKYPDGVRRGWRERLAGRFEPAPWTPAGSPERAEAARLAELRAATEAELRERGQHRGVSAQHARPPADG